MTNEKLLTEVGTVVEAYCKAVHDQDADAMRAIWTGDTRDVLISQSTIFEGLDAIVCDFLELLRSAYESITLVNDGLDAHLLTDDVAIVVFRYHTECIRRNTGEPYGIAGIETQVMRRAGGQWRIAHVQYHGTALS